MFMDTAFATTPDTDGRPRDHDRESAPEGDSAPSDEAMRLMAAQLDMLAFMRSAGAAMIERIERKAAGLLLEREQPAFQRCDPVTAFTRVSRSMLQIMAMEQEIMGLRERRRHEILTARVKEKKETVRRAVGDALVAQRPKTDPVSLRSLLNRAINDRDYYNDFLHDSPRAIIAKICAELGIENPDLSIWPDDAPDPSPDAGEESPQAAIARLTAEFAAARSGYEAPAIAGRANVHGPP